MHVLGRYLKCSNAVNSNASIIVTPRRVINRLASVNEFSNPFPRTDICHSLILKKQSLFAFLFHFILWTRDWSCKSHLMEKMIFGALNKNNVKLERITNFIKHSWRFDSLHTLIFYKVSFFKISTVYLQEMNKIYLKLIY